MRNRFYTMAAALILYSIGINAQEVKKDSVRINQYGLEVNWSKLNPEEQEGILNFTSDDGKYRFWLDTRVQFDGAVFSTDTYNEIGNGVDIRRARFAVKTQLWKNWYGELDLDFANSELELKDAYIKYTFDDVNLNIKGGHFKEGFGMETTTTSRYLTFMERSFVSKLDASRTLGVQSNYWGDKFLAIGGVHFRTVGGYEDVEISQDHNKDDGQDEGYSLTGRGVYTPINDKDKVLHLGIAGTYRTPKTTAEIPNSARISTRSHTSINRKKYLDTDDILNVDNTVGVNFELAGRYKSFMFQGEYKTATISRTDGLEDYYAEGFYIQGAYLLFGGHHNYNMKEGEFTRLSRGRKYGDLEVAFRYDFIDLNDFDAEIYGGSAEAYTFGLNYYFNPNVKVMMNYVYNNHDRFANGKGKLYVGHDANGDLTKDPFEVVEADGKAGDDFGMFAMRVEIDF